MAGIESVIADLAVQRIASKLKEGSKTIVKIKKEAIHLLLELDDVYKPYARVEGRTNLSSSDKVGELRRIACDIEDVVDTLVSKATTSSFLHLFHGTNPASKKLQILREQIREVKNKPDQYAQGSNKGLVSRARDSQTLKGHLHANADHVIGICQEIKCIVDQLTGGQSPVDRLAIVGMGGSGKTTLARSIYNHKAVEKHFYYRVWVSVSRGWDTSIVLLDILTQIRRQTKWFFALHDNYEEQHEHKPGVLISKLNELWYKRTCLLVFDDVWDLQSLHRFIDLIQNDINYSRTCTIVITSKQIPQGRINWCIHQPQNFNDEDSWKLFSMVASNSSKATSVEYRDLAMVLLRKSKGLPLAIVALARLLKTKDSNREWQQMLSQIEGEEGTTIYSPVKETLGLSYDELPCYLKPCFLYLALFPEGSTISGGSLIRMWIAEGFIRNEHLSDGKETLEAAGRRYLQELIDHTMVQVVEKTCSGKAKTIRLHDIMRDFCILKARELDFLTISSSDPEGIGKTSRRAAINLSKSFTLPGNSPHLRSLAILGQSSTSGVPDRYRNQLNQGSINLDKLGKMYKLLRVLDIVGIKSPDGTLPKEMGNLIHLTYLRIRYTNIRELPKSIGKLRNLLTLDYRDVLIGTEIQVPNVLSKLEKVRHLYLPEGMCGSIEALELHTLKDLTTLWGVDGGNWIFKEMDKLSSTLCKVYIYGISTEDQLNAVLGCPAMTGNSCLYALALNWHGFEFNIFDKLGANMSLLRLKLVGNAPDKSHNQGYEFPSNLRKLELHYTKLERPETLALLGRLGFLKVLILSKDSYIGSEWSCNDEAFPVLEELKLTKLPKLETWKIEKGAFRCLKKLTIVSCDKLKGMPEGLKLVTSLESLPCDFIITLQKVEGTNKRGRAVFDIIKHLPGVRFCIKVLSSCQAVIDKLLRHRQGSNRISPVVSQG